MTELGLGEHAFAQLGRWRRLSRWYEGTEASARAWLEGVSFGYLLGRVPASRLRQPSSRAFAARATLRAR